MDTLKTIQVSSRQEDRLFYAVLSERQIAYEEYKKVKLELDDLDAILSQIRGNYKGVWESDATAGKLVQQDGNTNLKTFADNYDIKATWISKIKFIIDKYGESSTSQIVDNIRKDYEPDVDRKKTVGTVSSVLSQNTGDGKQFIKRANSSNENLFSVNKNYGQQVINTPQAENQHDNTSGGNEAAEGDFEKEYEDYAHTPTENEVDDQNVIQSVLTENQKATEAAF